MEGRENLEEVQASAAQKEVGQAEVDRVANDTAGPEDRLEGGPLLRHFLRYDVADENVMRSEEQRDGCQTLVVSYQGQEEDHVAWCEAVVAVKEQDQAGQGL